MSQQQPIYCKTETDLLTLGEKLSIELLSGTIVFLQGDLGAGKTTLVRGILRGLGYNEIVKSPTFTLVESYDLEKIIVHHFDLYRLNDPFELESIGFRDYLNTNTLCLIEWPEKAQGYLPKADINFKILVTHDGIRIVSND